MTVAILVRKSVCIKSKREYLTVFLAHSFHEVHTRSVWLEGCKLDESTLRLIRRDHYREARETTLSGDLNLQDADAGCTGSIV